MKSFLLIVLVTFVLVFLEMYYEKSRDPYEEWAHWNYSIQCENGFVYKELDNRRGTIQVFNSDGTPLKCGQKIY